MEQFRGFLSYLDWASRIDLRILDADGMTPASRLRAARVSAGLSRPQLARKLGIHRVSVWRYEKLEMVSMERDLLTAWAAACHVPVSWVLSGKGSLSLLLRVFA